MQLRAIIGQVKNWLQVVDLTWCKECSTSQGLQATLVIRSYALLFLSHVFFFFFFLNS